MKKRSFKVLLLILMTVLAAAFGVLGVACGEPNSGNIPDVPPPPEATYTLTFMADGKEHASITRKAGESIVWPSNPVHTGYNFEGWHLKEDCSDSKQTLPLKMPAENRTYYAKFIPLAPLKDYTVSVYLQKLGNNVAIDEYELKADLAFSGTAPLGYPVDLSQTKVDHFKLNTAHAGGDVAPVIGETGNDFALYFDREIYKIVYSPAYPSDAVGTGGSMADGQYPYGATVTVADCGYFCEAYAFAGWSEGDAYGPAVPATDFVIDANRYFYARWDKGYRNAYDPTDILYVSSVVTSGLGACYRFKEDGSKKEGFLREDLYNSNIFEFTFYEESGDVVGQIDANEGTFLYRGAEMGNYVYYDYLARKYNHGAVLALDGYGKGILAESVSNMEVMNYYGAYSYDAEAQDWLFLYIDVASQTYTGEYFYFKLNDEDLTAENPNYTGAFLVQGDEADIYLLYDANGGTVNEQYILYLDGYGAAGVYYFDLESGSDEPQELLVYGTYFAGDNFAQTRVYEFRFETGDESYAPTRFMLTYVSGVDSDVYVYLVYDEAHAGTLTSSDGGSATLTLDGFYIATYIPEGMGDEDAIEGVYSIRGDTVTFIPYIGGEPSGKMYFDVVWEKTGDYIGTFTLNTEDILVVDGVVTGYRGTSSIVVIPDKATSIGEDAFNYMSDKNENGVSLTSVTIPATVTSIGARAFENNYTLSRVIFRATEPIDIDWDNTVDPFRWPKQGNFYIIVPEGSEEAYRTAWSASGYRILSLTELNNKPEWETDENGVLIAYHYKGEGKPENLSLKIPDEITEIGDEVFYGLEYIGSLDLNNVTKVGENAFMMSGLKSVIAEKLQYVGDGAFSLCTGLEILELPAALTVGDQAFAGCYRLARVILGAKLQSVGSEAFTYCASEREDHKFFLQLEGTTPPAMGGNLFNGVIYRRISVPTLEAALNCFGADDWNSYNTLLYVEESASSPLVGTWASNTLLEPMVFDGRAEFNNTEVWLYRVEGNNITFYAYDKETHDYSTFPATYKDGKVSFADSGTNYVLSRVSELFSYQGDDKSAAAGETLVLDLSKVDFESMPYVIPAKLNGKDITVTLAAKKITAIELIDGLPYRYTFTLHNDFTFTYTYKKEGAWGPFTAENGSEITLTFSGSLIYATGTLIIDGMTRTVESLGTWVVTQESESVFNISVPYLSTNYVVTVTLGAGDTFTYTWALGKTRTTYAGNGGAVVVYKDKNGNVIDYHLLLADAAGKNEEVEATYELQSDGSLLFTVDYLVSVPNADGSGFVWQESPYNGIYKVTVDHATQTCTITRQSASV